MLMPFTSPTPRRSLWRLAALFLAATLALLPALVTAADPPGILNHQGRIAVDGTNFNGAGQFKFALVNAAGDTSYWSNDNTSTTGDEPTAGVSVAVTQGHYAVLLGDAPMVEIPASVFAGNADVRLRIWFSADGGTSFEQLAPDRRIAAVGYALAAPAATGGATISANVLALPTTTASVGIITMNGDRLMHALGTRNFFAGPNAGNLTLTGADNTAVGDNAMLSNTTGASNVAIGARALEANTTGNVNTAVGQGSMAQNTTGVGNTALGEDSLTSNTIGITNTAIGQDALRSNTEGSTNTAVGEDSLRANTTGSGNTAVGENAMLLNTTADGNTAVGNQALENNTTGARNIAIGDAAGRLLTTGDDNIMIGHTGSAAETTTIRIGTGAQTRTFVDGIRGVTTGQADAVAVMIDSNGQLGTVSSSRRYKQNIRPMQQFGVSERLRQLRPVTFEYKQAQNGGEHPVQFGLIAEEVAEVFPELAVFNDEGQPETVKYHLLAPMLLEEVQKQQSALEEKDAEIGNLKARLESLEKAVSRLVGDKAGE